MEDTAGRTANAVTEGKGERKQEPRARDRREPSDSRAVLQTTQRAQTAGQAKPEGKGPETGRKAKNTREREARKGRTKARRARRHQPAQKAERMEQQKTGRTGRRRGKSEDRGEPGRKKQETNRDRD